MDKETLEAARVAAMDVATLATQAKGTIAMVLTAGEDPADMLGDAMQSLLDLQLRLDSARCLLQKLRHKGDAA